MLSLDAPGPAFSAPPQPFNMAAYVLAAAQKTPFKRALRIMSASGETDDWTYEQLARAVAGVAGGLINAGFAPGDLVLLRLGNTVDFPLAFLGAIWAGLVPVPTSAALTTVEISKMAADISPAGVIVADGIAAPEPAPSKVIRAETLHEMTEHATIPPHMGDANRAGYAIFTSGTSGHPRAVCHAHRAVWARRMMWQGWYGLTEDDRMLHAGAFNWTYTLGTGLMDPWAIGATALIPAPGMSAQDLPALLAAQEATVFAAAPGVYRQMMRAEMPPLPKLRHGLSAGEKLAPQIRADWHAATGTEIYEAFGMSECSTFVSGAPTRPAPKGALGYAQPGRVIAVLGPHGPVKRGEAGVLAVSRDDPGLMLGYIGHPDEAAAKMQGEWFLTGDRVIMAEDGALTYLGRDDDMMNAGGFKVSPVEVEAAMSALEGVSDCAAVELPIKETAKVIALFYTSAAPLDEATLKAHANTMLADYKRPRLYIHRNTLPRGANGKLLRRRLRDSWQRPET